MNNKKVNLKDILAKEAEQEAEQEAERQASLVKSETVYVSNEELGEPVYPSPRVSTNAKIIRDKISGMKVGELAHFAEFAFYEGNGIASRKSVNSTKALFRNEFGRISKEFGFRAQVRFTRTKGNKLTPSITIVEKRGS